MFFASQAVAYQMKRLGGGAMINLSSIIWRLKHTGLPVYSACKAAVIGLTRTQAREYGPFGIRVNSISPGAVWTERQIKLWYTPEFERDVMAGQCLQRARPSRRHRQHGFVSSLGRRIKVYRPGFHRRRRLELRNENDQGTRNFSRAVCR